MAHLERPDGVRIHWERRGSGPLVVLAPYATFHPSAYDPLEDELLPDHTVVRYDDRGTGASDRAGPYDMETGADDLEAVIEGLVGRQSCWGWRMPRIAQRASPPGGPTSWTRSSSSVEARPGGVASRARTRWWPPTPCSTR
jgi:pimeloyl-ACP methyl ester carboxylesterase